jgi:hypothetical protein
MKNTESKMTALGVVTGGTLKLVGAFREVGPHGACVGHGLGPGEFH